MVMKNRNCFQLMAPGSMSPATTIYTLCALILAERNLIVEMNIPNALKDLFIEQSDLFIQFYSPRRQFTKYLRIFSALLCGLNGFMVFLDDRAILDILSWQRLDIGCYEYFEGTLDEPKNSLRHKRTANILNGNCSDHMTGLAMAAFALFAKTAAELKI